MMYRIIRPPVLFLYSSVITRRPVQPDAGNPKTVCPCNILFQIIANHNNPFLILFLQSQLFHGCLKHNCLRLLLSHRFRNHPGIEAAAQSVFSVNILKGRFFPVRYKRNSVTFLMQLLQYFPCIFNKLRPAYNPRFLCIINLGSLVDNGVSVKIISVLFFSIILSLLTLPVKNFVLLQISSILTFSCLLYRKTISGLSIPVKPKIIYVIFVMDKSKTLHFLFYFFLQQYRPLLMTFNFQKVPRILSVVEKRL